MGQLLLRMMLIFLGSWSFIALGEEYVTVIDSEDQAVYGEIKSDTRPLTKNRIELHAITKAQQICTSKGMQWFRRGVKFEVFPPSPEEPKGYKITYLQCILHYSNNTKIVLGLVKIPGLDEQAITLHRSTTQETTPEEENLATPDQGSQLDLPSCEALNQTLLPFSPQKYITAHLKGVFFEDFSLKEQLGRLSDVLHRDGWKLDQGISQIAIYRATMMENMLDDLLPISVSDPSEQAFHVTMRRGIDACLGTAWDKNGIWAKAIATLPKKSVPDKLCGRLKTFIEARQRIKIAEEKFEEARAKNDITAKWLEWLGKSELAAPLAINVLDSAILAVLKSIAHHEKSSPISALDRTVMSALDQLAMSIETGIQNDNVELCSVRWPLKDSDIQRTQEEIIVGAVAEAVKTYGEIVALADKGKKKKEGFSLLSVVPLVDLPPSEKDEYLRKEKAYLLSAIHKKIYRQLDDEELDLATRSGLIQAAQNRIEEVIRAHFKTGSEAALMVPQWLEFLKFPEKGADEQ